jgi:hypothetical protein
MQREMQELQLTEDLATRMDELGKKIKTYHTGSLTTVAAAAAMT